LVGALLRDSITKCHLGEAMGLKSAKKESPIIWMAPNIIFYQIQFLRSKTVEINKKRMKNFVVLFLFVFFYFFSQNRLKFSLYLSTSFFTLRGEGREGSKTLLQDATKFHFTHSRGRFHQHIYTQLLRSYISKA